MRRPTALTTICLALAASTTWLAIELHAARQEIAELRGAPAPMKQNPVLAPAGTNALAPGDRHLPADVSQTPGEAAPDRDSAQTRSDPALRAANLAHNAWVRSWLDDPDKRAKILDASRKSFERGFPRKELDLGQGEYTRVRDTWAASDLRYSEAVYRCNIDANCNLQSTLASQMQARHLELVALLGDDKTERLENYSDNFVERNCVASFRSDLPESMRMTDAQAEQLTEALGEERRSLVKEWQERGDAIGGMGNSWGSLNYPETRDIERRTAAAREFQRRQRNRAAEILTSGQLEVFTRQQEQMLEIARGSWEDTDPAGKSR